MEVNKFEQWCIVELFGHQKIAGYCTEQNIAGVNMLRVDVPETDTQPSFTKLYGGAAVYAINPVDEETVKIMVKMLQIKPIEAYNINTVIAKLQAHNTIAQIAGNSEVDSDDEMVF